MDSSNWSATIMVAFISYSFNSCLLEAGAPAGGKFREIQARASVQTFSVTLTV